MIIYVIQKNGGNKNSPDSLNKKLTLPQRKQGNYPVIPIYNTNATTTSIKTQLISLDAYIGTIGCDITMFSAHVKLLLAGLSARGETSNDMLIKIVKGYKAT